VVEDAADVTKHGAPRWTLLWSEPGRSAAELASLFVSGPFLRRAARGDGHSVLVLPGFLADDKSTAILRRYLTFLGYNAYGWELGRNIGPSSEILDGMERMLERLARSSGGKVSVVGWSMGGMFARGLGRQMPEHIRQVITLGSPFRGEEPIGSHASGPYERLSHRHVPISELPPAEEDRLPLDVPLTAVYSRGDGIVAWQSCVNSGGIDQESIEVVGSHCGLGHNPAAMWIVADRLAQPLGSWAPFMPPAFAQRLYPAPAAQLRAG
jgi:pimeloyl-ACP methyl ester carboxylesterase